MRAALFALAAAALIVSPAHAKESACKADVQKLCKDVRPGGGRILQCLAQHDTELSEGCKAERSAGRQKFAAIAAACRADAEKFCAEVQPGKGRIARCLRHHHSQLSAECRDSAKAGRKGPPPGEE